MASVNHLSPMTEFAVEIDFLVAQKNREDAYYDDIEPDNGSRIRWALDKGHPDPVRTCVMKVVNLMETFAFQPPFTAMGGLAYASEYPISDDDPFSIVVPTSERDNVLPRQSYWLVSPSYRAAPREDSPKDYDWMPVTIRSPYRSLGLVIRPPGFEDRDPAQAEDSPDSIDPFTPPIHRPGTRARTAIERVMAMIRASIKIHVNSTCEARIYLNHLRDGFDHIEAKKMLTMCWLQEPTLLLPLQPQVNWIDRPRPQPFTQCSELARKWTKFPEAGSSGMAAEDIDRILAMSRPYPPPDADIMDAYIPEFINPVVKEKIQHIWGAQSLGELSSLVESVLPGVESAIAINLHGHIYRPSFEFRYALWHPQKEGLQHWLQLLGIMFIHATSASKSRFKKLINEMQKCAAEIQNHDKEDQWKAMIAHGFHGAFSTYWNELKKEYRDGGVLSPQALDQQGIVPSIENLDYDSQGVNEYSTTTSSSDWEPDTENRG